MNSESRRARGCGAAASLSLFLALAAAGLAPAARGAAPPAARGIEVAKTHCARCHEAGTQGAPRPGDKAAWAPRLSRGLDALVLVAIRGHGGMPPRGGKADLTDAELRSALLYLFDPAGTGRPPPAGPAIAPGPSPERVTVGGMDVYLGRVSAERMRAWPAGSPEAKLHGGVPSGSGYYHVDVCVFDSATQAPLPDAGVALDVEQVGMGRRKVALEPVTLAGARSQGAYVRLLPHGDYLFRVQVKRSAGAAPVEATFREKAD